MIRQWYNNIYKTIWNIGFVDDELSDILQGRNNLRVHWMVHSYSDRWFADPFLLDVTNDYFIVLAEVYYRNAKKARIEKLHINRSTYKLEACSVVLDLDTHLSFPLIRKKQGEIFIYPENGKSGTFNKYVYDVDKNHCEFVEMIISESLADAVPTDLTGRFIITATRPPLYNGDILNVFVKDKKGSFVFHSKYSFNGRKIARNAGDWFKYKDKVYRPAQDCEKEYGGSMLIQEVICDKNGIPLDFIDVVRINPQSTKYYSGCHTFNLLNNHIVIDGWGYQYKYLKNICLAIAKLKDKILHY